MQNISTIEKLKAPFVYYGGKSLIANEVWQRFGDVPQYIEPFFGSGAILLSRPHPSHIELVNDLDVYLTNFWRALKNNPQALVEYCKYPVSELDLHARHKWLVTEGKELIEKLRDDPFYYNIQVAGYWLWGICQWIGGEWCKDINSLSFKRPHISHQGHGIFTLSLAGNIEDLLIKLSKRLERVRILCGDWKRIVTPNILNNASLSGIFLDPPYAHDTNRHSKLYAQESTNVSREVVAWAIENGNNAKLRIAVCGLQGEHEFPDTWEALNWKTQTAFKNTDQEMVWFSPHCLKVSRNHTMKQIALF